MRLELYLVAVFSGSFSTWYWQARRNLGLGGEQRHSLEAGDEPEQWDGPLPSSTRGLLDALRMEVERKERSLARLEADVGQAPHNTSWRELFEGLSREVQAIDSRTVTALDWSVPASLALEGAAGDAGERGRPAESETAAVDLLSDVYHISEQGMGLLYDATVHVWEELTSRALRALGSKFSSVRELTPTGAAAAAALGSQVKGAASYAATLSPPTSCLESLWKEFPPEIQVRIASADDAVQKTFSSFIAQYPEHKSTFGEHHPVLVLFVLMIMAYMFVSELFCIWLLLGWCARLPWAAARGLLGGSASPAAPKRGPARAAHKKEKRRVRRGPLGSGAAQTLGCQTTPRDMGQSDGGNLICPNSHMLDAELDRHSPTSDTTLEHSSSSQSLPHLQEQPALHTTAFEQLDAAAPEPEATSQSPQTKSAPHVGMVFGQPGSEPATAPPAPASWTAARAPGKATLSSRIAASFGHVTQGGASFSSVAAEASTPQPSAGQADIFVVEDQGDDTSPSAGFLVGEYAETGAFIKGRKVYQKRAAGCGGAPEHPVFMYYWDSSDGPEWEGWWIGESVGGKNVWSHCGSSDRAPPEVGWRFPWNGDVRGSLRVRGFEQALRRA